MKIILTLLFFSSIFVTFSQDYTDLGSFSYEAANSKAYIKYNGAPCGEKENVINSFILKI